MLKEELFSPNSVKGLCGIKILLIICNLKQIIISPDKLVLELHKNEISPVGTGPTSHILHLDGEAQEEVVKFSFESTYHIDDINELLIEIFLESEVNLTLESRVKVAPLSARELYVIRLEPTTAPQRKRDQADVFENVKRLKGFFYLCNHWQFFHHVLLLTYNVSHVLEKKRIIEC